MKTDTKKIGGCRVQLNVTLDAAETDKVVKEVEKVFLRNARIPGFRPGKAPIDIVRRNFAADIAAEAMQRVVSANLPQAVKAEDLDFVDIVEVKDVSCTPEGGAFSAVVDLKPQFKLPTYKGLKISKKDTAVAESAVESAVEEMRDMHSTYADAAEGDVVAEGDYAQIDYSGTVDGKPILEVAPEAKMVASATGYWVRVREGYFLAEILDAIKGMKAGETKTGIKAVFDKKAAPEGLGGKKALYDVTVKTLRRRVLPDDAKLAEALKAESFDKLKADIRSRLEKRAVELEESRREDEAYDLLLKKTDFPVPQSIVDRQRDTLLASFAERAGISNINADVLKERRDELLADLGAQAERQVRYFYLAEAIAKAENLDCKDEDRGRKVMEFVLANAK
ncbi:MAG: trigger factor [Kiritimatiellae bacterium]|nr:trigger factor [Kiritimatiellia bacterium]